MMKAFSRIKLYSRILSKAADCIVERISNPGAAYLVLTPEHGNLGDHAIAQSEHIVLNRAGIKVIEITGKELQKRRELGLLRLMNGRTIFINGGGNLGTLWFSVEELIRNIIITNNRSRICIFPSTIYYADTEFGNREKERSIDIYNAHKKLTLYLREQESFQLALKLYKDIDVILMPDMAMLLNYCEPHLQRSGCILSLRADCEKTRNAEQDGIIINQVSELFGTRYYYLDMVVNNSIPINRREDELLRQIEAFKRAELVITDRLHGMVFSAITGTPCIVIDSISPKVKGCYEWIKHLDYIRFCKSASKISEVYFSMPKGSQEYTNSDLIPYYDKLSKDITEMVRKRWIKCQLFP